ncbi:hypothetical protein GCM10027445_50450 [Amycolatopsis endophytica]|uniref:DUF2637 domain-containing protein n=1 Tax=Amycolatopsis endophytica TaxID=860233 RepID=A0A853AZ08_9PSEU|nr:hypothetical protein [Amycolatopsis endophytica]NYI87882.1 hypothetical protein [Amycolatopsis endophytica]
MSWQDERRANRRAEALIRREDAAAAAQVRIAERQAAAQIQRAEEQARAKAREEAADKRRARWRSAWSGLRAWLGGHVVELLIYPIALLSFALAAPSMAAYGTAVYGSALGALLPGITELGMWAFAVAVVIARRRHPDRSVWGLVAGVLVFGAVAFGINFTHGLTVAWDHGVVMGIGSIAGVVAHQLTLAGPPRTRAERRAARIERAAARKIARVRTAAVRAAVAEIDPDGTARLVFVPGRYTLTRRGLTTATVPGLPVAETGDWDRALADLLATDAAATDAAAAGEIEPDPTPRDSIEGGAIATADRAGEQQKSSRRGPKIGGRPARTIGQLRTELEKLMRARPGSIDPTKAEQIRKALRCSPKSARELREHYRKGHQD